MVLVRGLAEGAGAGTGAGEALIGASALTI